MRKKVGTLLHRTQMGLLVFFFLLACGGESESTIAAPEADRGEAPIDEVAPKETSPGQRALPAVSADRRSAEPKRSNPKPRQAADARSEVDADLRSALNWAVLEYRSAFVGRDMAKLESRSGRWARSSGC